MNMQEFKKFVTTTFPGETRDVEDAGSGFGIWGRGLIGALRSASMEPNPICGSNSIYIDDARVLPREGISEPIVRFMLEQGYEECEGIRDLNFSNAEERVGINSTFFQSKQRGRYNIGELRITVDVRSIQVKRAAA